jgi:SulP family sulfate permease
MSTIVNVFGALVAGILVVVLSVSFSAIVYTGPLEVVLDRGIGATLVGAFVACVVGGALYSYKATIPNPQDLTAILLAGAAAQIAATMGTANTEALFATIFALLITASALAGLVVFLAGRFRLSDVVRYIPYPVMGGFLAATGYLLVVGAIGMLLGRSMDIWSLASILAPDDLVKWLPWMIVGAAILVVSRLSAFGFTLPLALLLMLAAFYAFLFLTGQDLEAAAERGLLLGPFGSGGFLEGLRPGLVTEADWSLVAGQGLTLIAVVAMVFLGAGLNLSGIELVVDQELDPNRDFRAIGLATMAAAPTGGLLGFPGFAATILGYRLGVTSYPAVALAGGVCLATAIFGASLLELLPRGLFGATIIYIGLDLLANWLWTERRRLMPRDWAVVAVILLASALLGFLVALALGLAVSILTFVISYSSQDFVRLKSNLAVRRSSVERPFGDVAYLGSEGGQVVVYEFMGYLFFGTSTRLRALVDHCLNHPDGKVSTIILDFSHVSGIDPSVSLTLQRIEEAASRRGIRLHVTGLSDELSAIVQRFNGRHASQGHPTLEDALRDEEERLLMDRPEADTRTFLDRLRSVLDGREPEEAFPLIELDAGTELIRAGDPSEQMYILLSGSALVSVVAANGRRRTIAEMMPGALMGEIGFLGQQKRTADVTLTAPSRLLKIDEQTLARLAEMDPAFDATLLRLVSTYLAQRMDRSTRLISALLR